MTITVIVPPRDPDITALENLTVTGLLTRASEGVFYGRTITGSTGLTVADGSGVAANPTLTLDSDLVALASNSTSGFWTRTGTGTGSARTITGTANQIGVTNGDGVSGNPVFALLGNTLALSGLSGAADKLAYFTSASTMALTDLTSEARTFLASTAQAAYVFVTQSGTGAVSRSVGASINDRFTPEAFGAVGDGTTNDLTAFQNAITALGEGTLYLKNKTYGIDGTLTIPNRVTLSGQGCAAYSTSIAPTTLKALSASVVVLISGEDAELRDLNVDGNNLAVDCVQFTGSRIRLRNVSAHRSARDGFREGDDNVAAVYNANVWEAQNLYASNNARHGLYVHDAKPATDNQGGMLLGMDARNNGGDGICMGTSANDTIIGAVCQGNSGYNIRLSSDSRAHTVIKSYTEVGNGGVIESGASNHIILGATYSPSAVQWADNSGLLTNILIQTDDRFQGSSFGFGPVVNAVNAASGGRAYVNYHADTDLLKVASTEARVVSSTGGIWTLKTKTVGGSLANCMIFDAEQRLTLPGSVIYMEDGAAAPLITTGSGSPEGVVTARIGSLFMRKDGGAGTSFYVKESGTGNTGWVAK